MEIEDMVNNVKDALDALDTCCDEQNLLHNIEAEFEILVDALRKKNIIT